MTTKFFVALCLVFCTTNEVFSGVISNSALGINSAGLTHPGSGALTGADVQIGQVEEGRPVDPDVDFALYNSTIDPAGVWVIAQNATQDQLATNHATWMASVMISTDITARGVAPGASLFSSAYVNAGDYDSALRSIQHVATRPGGVRAVNMSFGMPGGNPIDGSSLLTAGVDWLADRREFLAVAAGNQDKDAYIYPTDNFNGITVGSSSRIDGGFYREVSYFNRFDADVEGSRTSVDLLAPGENIQAVGFFDAVPDDEEDDGTSYAAAHVTGAVALLQEYGNGRFDDPEDNAAWLSEHYKKPQVMKAVLLNSADKLFNVHGSQREVVARAVDQGYNWLDSLAFSNDTITLDEQLGAGHLNVGRALDQFKSGEVETAEIPLLGWDYGETAGIGTTLRYTFADDLAADSYVAITLAWNRRVDKFGGSANTYGTTDFFGNFDMANLDLYLMPVGWTGLEAQYKLRSISGEDNLEHVFAKVDAAGQYEIVVYHEGGYDGDQPFGLAWWGVSANEQLEGDLNGDGNVDDQDLEEWKDGFGTNYDGGHFLAWQRNYGATSVVAVPEPSALLLSLLGFVACRSLASRGDVGRLKKFGNLCRLMQPKGPKSTLCIVEGQRFSLTAGGRSLAGWGRQGRG